MFCVLYRLYGRQKEQTPGTVTEVSQQNMTDNVSSLMRRKGYHDAVMNEATSVMCRPQMWIFLGARHSHVPHTTPRPVQVTVYRVDTGVVRRHCVAHVHWDVMSLQHQHRHPRLYHHRYHCNYQQLQQTQRSFLPNRPAKPLKLELDK